MSNLNTLPIEMFLDKARIAIKSNQKNLILDIREVQALTDSLAIVMTRLAGQTIVSSPTESIQVKMDGGKF
jgi:hypothetical protein